MSQLDSFGLSDLVGSGPLTPANHTALVDDHKFAIVETVTESYYVEGDERSRTNPGHGYPAGYETRSNTTFTVFDTKEELAQRLKFSQPKGKYKVIAFREVTVETEMVVTLH